MSLWYYTRNFIVYFRWLVRVTLVGCFWLFAPKFWEVAGTYRSFFCHSMNAWMQVQWWRYHEVVGPSNPNYMLKKRIYLNLLHSKVMRTENFGHERSCPLLALTLAPTTHLVKLSLPNICLFILYMRVQAPILWTSFPQYLHSPSLFL